MIIPRSVIDVAGHATSSLSSSMACDDIHHCRTVAGIVFNCASTMFLCTWVAFHPNVPRNPEDVWWKKLLRRIKFMIIALLAPEFVFSTAIWEWVNSSQHAMQIANKYPNCRLTETHFMFGWMGGFQLVNGGGKEQLREDEFFQKLYNGEIEILTIKEGEIRDKGKSDYIAKAITLVQTLWFAIQAANRINQGLPMTELELTTLAHVVLNIFVFSCWWKKPLNVDYPVDVFPKREDERVDETSEEHELKEHGAEQVVESRKPFPRREESAHEISEKREAEEHGAEQDLESQKYPLTLRVRMGAYMFGIIMTQSKSWRNAISMSFCFSIIGGAFGAVHCLAWNSTFPTRVEHILWRVCALLVTVIPGIVFSICSRDPTYTGKLGDLLKSLWHIPLIVIYCIARACLLVDAVATLRNLPYNAYVSPSWTRYIPHIG